MTLLPWLLLAALTATVTGLSGDYLTPQITADGPTGHDASTTEVGTDELTTPVVGTGEWVTNEVVVTDHWVTTEVAGTYPSELDTAERTRVTRDVRNTEVASHEEEGPCPRGCQACARGDLQYYYCGNQVLKYKPDDQGYMEVVCNENTFLNCSALPPLPARRGGPLSRVEVTSCALPPHLPLTCATGGAGSDALLLSDSLSSLTVDNVRSLDADDLFLSFQKGVLTELPMAALASLPRLRKLRLVGGAAPPLAPHMFNVTPHLTYLEISSCGLTEIPGQAFVGMTNLTILNLCWNKITKIDENAFEGLESLEQLVLTKNPIEALPARALTRAPRLRALRLERLAVATVGEGTFEGLDHLEELFLTSDRNLTFSPRALSVPSLVSLKVTYSGVTSLPPDVFAGARLLANLTLSHNKLRSLPVGLFVGLSSLEMLELDNNNLQHISNDLLLPLASLVELRLDYNQLTSLPDNLFSGLNKLMNLYIAHNQISSISPVSFSGAASLVRLSLSHNRLAWAPSEIDSSSPFNMLQNLEFLDLSFNEISVVYSDWCVVLLQLKELDLAHNNLTSLTQADVQFLGSPSVVLTHNKISRVQPRPWWDNRAPSAARIQLHHNPFICDCWLFDFINEIQAGPGRYDASLAACASPPPLEGRPLRRVSPLALTCALPAPAPCSCVLRPALERAECVCNTTDQLPDIEEFGTKKMALRLTRLAPARDLARLPDTVHLLNLTRLNVTHLPRLPDTIHSLDLTHNNINILPTWIWESNLTLLLSNNPIKCECSTTDDVLLLQLNKHRIVDFANVTCADGSTIEHKDANILCNVYKSTLAGAMFAFTILLIGILTAIIIYYRVLIQVYLYSKGWCLYLLPKEEEDLSKIYDVFVSFASDDEKFVRELILPKLNNYSLHVQDRDWIVGNTIPFEIHRSVEESKRTLILLSTSFLKSKWALEEFRSVHCQATNDKRRRAVVVLLDLTKKDLDKEILDLLSLSTYIKFNEILFWEKLRYALPRKDLICEVKGGKQPLSWNGGLQVVLNEEGKLVNRAYVKDEL